jgi:hypothetical protein
MQTTENHCSSGVTKRKETIEAAMVKLMLLKRQISELRFQCEDLKRQQLAKQSFASVCVECGRQVNKDQEVTLKDSFGKIVGVCHKDCFKAIWLSQTWRFDYSCPGFLRMSEKNR